MYVEGIHDTVYIRNIPGLLYARNRLAGDIKFNRISGSGIGPSKTRNAVDECIEDSKGVEAISTQLWECADDRIGFGKTTPPSELAE